MNALWKLLGRKLAILLSTFLVTGSMMAADIGTNHVAIARAEIVDEDSEDAEESAKEDAFGQEDPEEPENPDDGDDPEIENGNDNDDDVYTTPEELIDPEEEDDEEDEPEEEDGDNNPDPEEDDDEEGDPEEGEPEEGEPEEGDPEEDGSDEDDVDEPEEDDQNAPQNPDDEEGEPEDGNDNEDPEDTDLTDEDSDPEEEEIEYDEGTPGVVMQGGELKCSVETDDDAFAIAEQYGLVLISIEDGVAVFSPMPEEKDRSEIRLNEIIESGKEAGFPELQINWEVEPGDPEPILVEDTTDDPEETHPSPEERMEDVRSRIALLEIEIQALNYKLTDGDYTEEDLTRIEELTAEIYGLNEEVASIKAQEKKEKEAAKAKAKKKAAKQAQVASGYEYEEVYEEDDDDDDGYYSYSSGSYYGGSGGGGYYSSYGSGSSSLSKLNSSMNTLKASTYTTKDTTNSKTFSMPTLITEKKETEKSDSDVIKTENLAQDKKTEVFSNGGKVSNVEISYKEKETEEKKAEPEKEEEPKARNINVTEMINGSNKKESTGNSDDVLLGGLYDAGSAPSVISVEVEEENPYTIMSDEEFINMVMYAQAQANDAPKLQKLVRNDSRTLIILASVIALVAGGLGIGLFIYCSRKGIFNNGLFKSKKLKMIDQELENEAMVIA